MDAWVGPTVATTLALGASFVLMRRRRDEARSSSRRKQNEPSSGIALQIAGDAGILAEVRRAVSTDASRPTEPIRDRGVVAGLQALMQHAPALLRGAAALGDKTYIVRFAPEVARGLADGSLTVMQAVGGGLRATAIDSGGRIVGNAVLSSPSAAVNGALVVWQLMALVTAQKFLADINQRLDGIEHAVTAVREWLEDAQQGELTGGLRYMRSLADSLAKCEITEAEVRTFCGELESIERAARDVMAMQERQHTRLVAEFDKLELQGMGFDARSEAVSGLIAAFARSSEPWWVAAQVRALAHQLRARLPLSRDVSLMRIRELQSEVLQHEMLGKGFVEAVRLRVSELDSFFTREKTAAEHQYRIRLETVDIAHRLGAAVKDFTGVAAQVERELQRPNDGLGSLEELLVTVDDSGVPVRVERALPSAA